MSFRPIIKKSTYKAEGPGGGGLQDPLPRQTYLDWTNMCALDQLYVHIRSVYDF